MPPGECLASTMTACLGSFGARLGVRYDAKALDPSASDTTKFPREEPQRGNKKRGVLGERRKKSARLWMVRGKGRLGERVNRGQSTSLSKWVKVKLGHGQSGPSSEESGFRN